MTRNIAIVLMGLLAGCSLAPKFERPESETPAQFKELTPAERGNWKTAQPAEAQPRGEWWRAFHDPALDQLEADAITANQTLKAAAARVSQARALVGVARADRSPQVLGVADGGDHIVAAVGQDLDQARPDYCRVLSDHNPHRGLRSVRRGTAAQW